MGYYDSGLMQWFRPSREKMAGRRAKSTGTCIDGAVDNVALDGNTPAVEAIIQAFAREIAQMCVPGAPPRRRSSAFPYTRTA